MGEKATICIDCCEEESPIEFDTRVYCYHDLHSAKFEGIKIPMLLVLNPRDQTSVTSPNNLSPSVFVVVSHLLNFSSYTHLTRNYLQTEEYKLHER